MSKESISRQKRLSEILNTMIIKHSLIHSIRAGPYSVYFALVGGFHSIDISVNLLIFLIV